MYFKYSRKKGDDYIRFLLDEKFHKNNILNPKGKRLTVQELSDYVINLQISIRHWFYIHNPSFPLPGYENEENKKLLNRMNRVGFKHFKPLLLACFVSNQNMESINELLKYAEKYNFTLFSMCRRRANVGDTELFSLAQSILVEEVGMYTVMDRVRSIIDRYYSEDKFYDYIHEKYNVGRNGFYHWDGLNYFLYEYEQYLLENGKQSSSSIDWKELQKKRSDSETIEHVLPQKVGLTDLYWRERFHDRYSEEQIFFMAHSLGNLVPLSRAKNSSVSNASFREKKDNGRGIGYYNGSAAENELNKYEDWTPTSILERGIALLKFMEARWDISLGDNSFKVKLLHMDFLSS